MDSFKPPVPGATLNNDELTAAFLRSGQGGMRRSKRTNTLVIISNHVDSVYDDCWINDVLHYTDMGQIGPQSLEFNQNRTLNESPTNGVAVHLFEVFTKCVYTYIGEVVLADKSYKEQQLDAEGDNRPVWVFPLRLRAGSLPEVPDITLRALDQIKEKQARYLSDTEVEKLARQQGQARVGLVPLSISARYGLLRMQGVEPKAIVSYAESRHRLSGRTAAPIWKHTISSGWPMAGLTRWRTPLQFVLIATEKCTW